MCDYFCEFMTHEHDYEAERWKRVPFLGGTEREILDVSLPPIESLERERAITRMPHERKGLGYYLSRFFGR
jgi:hypothetical protein